MEQIQHNQDTIEHLQNGVEKDDSINRFFSVESWEPIIAVIERKIGNEKFFAGSFSYLLESICKSNNVEDIDVLSQKAFDWSRNIIHTLNNYPDTATLSIRFIQYPETRNTESCNIIIALTATVVTDSFLNAEKNTKALLRDLQIVIDSNNNEHNYPFNFSGVTEPEKLMQLINRNEKLDYYVINRPSIQTKEKMPMGFKGNGVLKNNHTTISIPVPSKIHDQSLSGLLKILNANNSHSEITILLKAVMLNGEEKNRIKNSTDKLYSYSSEIVNTENIDSCRKYCKRLLNTQQPIFFANVILATKKNVTPSNTLINAAGSAFIEYPFYSGYTKVGNSDKFHQVFFTKEFSMDDFRFCYTSEDIIGLFRLPLAHGNELSGVKLNHPAYYSLPYKLSRNGILLGVKKSGNKNFPIKISSEDLSKHLYILGQTGTGKTTLMNTMILDLIKKGEGIALVDPHGDLLNTVLENIPENRKKDVILFDPTDIQNCNIRINILGFNTSFPEQKTFIFNEMMKIFHDLWDMSRCGGPMFEMYLKCFMFLVMDTMGGTLRDIINAFENKDFRNTLLLLSNNKNLHGRIQNMLDGIGESSFVNFIPYITSKLNRFTEDHFLGPIISEQKSNIDFRNIMDNNKILLVRLPKGRLGDEGVKFLGTVILNRIILAAYSRENIPEKERVNFTLFVDEFQNFTSSDICNALAEARKYHLRLVLANQNFSQLDKNIFTNLMGNVGNLITFRPSVFDADQIEPYLKPVFTAQDMAELSDYNCVARLLINNVPSKPFMFQTIP